MVGLQPVTTFKIERKAKKPLGDAAVAPYWLVRRVQDKNIANMRRATIQCTLTSMQRRRQCSV